MFQNKVTHAARQLASQAAALWPTLLAKRPSTTQAAAKAAPRSNTSRTPPKRLGPNVEIQVLRRRLKEGAHSG